MSACQLLLFDNESMHNELGSSDMLVFFLLIYEFLCAVGKVVRWSGSLIMEPRCTRMLYLELNDLHD